MSSGDMKVLLDLTATARPRIGGAVISQDEWIRIKRLFRGAKRGLVKVRTRCGTPSNATDYALSCPEELIPLARGLIMEVDRADRNNDSWPIALQNNMLPLSQDHLQVIERMVNGRPEQERLERRQKAADKRLEINGRKCDDFDSMTPLERALNLGNARLRSMQRVCGPTSKPDKRGLNREGFTVWKESNAQRASTTYGFGTLRKSASGKRRIMPQTSVRMIDTGGDGIFEQSVHFGRAQGRPEEANLGLLFLTFEGEWVS